MIRLQNYLSPNLIFKVPRGTPEELFKFVGDVLKERGYASEPAKLVNELVEREKKGSTGFGHGIAVPHAFLPGLSRLVIVTLLVKKGIDFGAPDGLPVKVLFVVLGPEQKRDDYLKLLAGLATALHDPAVRRKVVSAKKREDVYNSLIEKPYENFLYTNRQYLYFLGIIGGIFLFSRYFFPRIFISPSAVATELDYLRFNGPPWVTSQVVTFTVFLAIGVGTLLFWEYRVAIASAALGVMLLSGVVDLETTVRFMSMPTILFIISMMVVVAWLDSNGVFKYLITSVMKRIGPKPRNLYIILLFLSVLLGGLIGEVSAIIVTVTLAVSVTKRLNVDPFPFIVGLVFATNIGSALTMIGNPIGIYIAFAGNLAFNDFLRWATPLSFCAAALVIMFVTFLFRTSLPTSVPFEISGLDPWQSVRSRREFYLSIISFLILVSLISTHEQIESLLHLGESTVLVAAPLILVGMIIFIEKERGKKFLVKDVDWWTILFFMFLFANAACLEYTGVTAKFAYLLERAAQMIDLPLIPAEYKVTAVAGLLLLFSSALASGFIDNLPIIAALVPIVLDLRNMGLPHVNILWWALLFGGCFGGNLTMIGSSANVVALAKYEEMTGRTIRFRYWFRYGLPVVILSVVIIAIALLLQTPLSP
jgi:Na+/H+ antiporter NhaD/arsenite permease-like protein/mannitol/fructose-specific phosphotransferase system IIA component (Ntr-type)